MEYGDWAVSHPRIWPILIRIRLDVGIEPEPGLNMHCASLNYGDWAQSHPGIGPILFRIRLDDMIGLALDCAYLVHNKA